MYTQEIAEILAARGPMTADELCFALGAEPQDLIASLTALLSKGWIEPEGDRLQLAPDQDILTAYGVSALYRGRTLPLSPSVYPILASTNTELFRLAQEGAPEGRWIAAGAQSAGIGRMGRSFFSPGDTGLYMSLLLRPKENADIALRLTTAAAVAVCETLQAIGLPARIKWVNDIYIEDKKVCGILAQASWKKDASGIDFVVLGIGINVYPPEGGFPEEIAQIAASLGLPRRAGTRDRIAAGILTRLDELYSNLQDASYMERYRRHSLLTDKAITVHKGDARIPAHCLGIDDECHLLVRYEDGSVEALSSGEVSTKLR